MKKINEEFLGKHNLSKDVFENISDLVHYLKTDAKVNTNIFNKHDLSSHEHRNDSWSDYKTFDEALNALEYGTDKYSTEISNKVKKFSNIISQNMALKRGKYKNDVVGFLPIVPNVINGTPINMINENYSKKQVPTLKIVIEKAVSARINNKDSIKFYSAIFALVQAIEQKGIRCELLQSAIHEEGDEIYLWTLKLKDCMQPMNTYKLSFPIVSTDMFRKIGFNLLETCQTIKKDYWEVSYGHICALRCDYCDFDNENNPNERYATNVGYKRNRCIYTKFKSI